MFFYNLFVLNTIAHIRTDFPTKFGIPRQSGVVESLRGTIVFEPPYRNADYIRGIEKYTHLWLIWLFSANKHQKSSPLVRPPSLGGNTHVGVFATRSPYRPNPIGLSAVRIEKINYNTPDGPTISVRGADLMDGTPIIDIKPYITYADSIPEARSGFVDEVDFRKVDVCFPDDIKSKIPAETADTLTDILTNDPRPSYHDDASKVYGMRYANYDIHFRVCDGILTVVGIEENGMINQTSI